MSVIWKKVWRDVWNHKARTVQVVLSIAVGVLAVGLTLGLQDLQQALMTLTWQAATPAHIHLSVGGVDRETIRALGGLPGIEGAEGMASSRIRWRLRPEDDWRDAFVFARADYEAQKYDRLTLIDGSWPVRGGVTVDRGSARALKIPPEGTVYFEVNDRPRSMRIVGVTHDARATPPAFSSEANFYVTRRDMEQLGGPAGFTQVKAVLPEYEEGRAKEAGLAMTDRLERLGVSHGTPEVFDPQRHSFQDVVDGVHFLLVAMALLTLGLSLFLVINTITAIITEQVPQIGVMKAIGAGSWRLFGVYLSGVMIYVTMALVLAIPLGAVGASQLNVWIAGLFNMEPEGFSVSSLAVSVQLALGLLAPLLAALRPVTSGARITVREAISSYGLSAGVGLIERALARLRRLPPLVVLTVSNTFRRKGRLALTQVALVGAGAIFMMVMSVQASMLHTFDVFLETHHFDVFIGFERPQRIEEIEALVASFPGVSYAEAIETATGLAVRRVGDKEGRDQENITLLGVSEGGRAYRQVVTAGRWLLPEDEYAMVLNRDLANELGVSLGDDVVVTRGSGADAKESTWNVVGLLYDIYDNQTASAVWRDTLERELPHASRGRAGTLYVGAMQDDAESLSALAHDLREWLDEARRDVSRSLTSARFKSEQTGGMMIIVYLLAVVAILIAAVGGIGLSGALAINALERRREIGVMRAIGASGRAIGGIFVGEGAIIGLASWAIALPLSVPLGWAFTQAIGSVIKFPLMFRFSLQGVGVWLLLVIALSVLASGLPAWRAARVSVRQSLAYE